MNRAALILILFASFIASISHPVLGQETPVPEANDDTAQAAARKILEDAKERAAPMIKNASQHLIEQQEIELNAIRPRAVELEREMRFKDRRGGVNGSVDNLTGKRAGDDAELTARKVDIKRLTENIDRLKREHDLNILKAAWLLISHENRMQIIESGCLSEEESQIVQATLKVDKISLPRLENSIGMKLRQIPAGEFEMGGSGSAMIASAARVRNVKISAPFWMAETEVTQKQYQEVTGENPSTLKASGFLGLFSSNKYDNHPVDAVTWYQAVAFCRSLSKREEEKSANHWYRLPTEAEWEYACRAGTTTSFHFGSFQSVKGTEANINWKAFGSHYTENNTVAVGTYAPNAFGLFEMHGNVAEWCSDWYSEDYYLVAPDVDPPGPAIGKLLTRGNLMSIKLPEMPIGEYKATRGGDFSSRFVQDACLSNSRKALQPTQSSSTGIRIVCEITANPSAVLREQYQHLAEFEAGKTRSHLLNAQKEYYGKLRAVRDTNLALANQLEQHKKGSKIYADGALTIFATLAQIYTDMAAAYERTGDTERACSAHVEAGNWSLKREFLYVQGGWYADPQQLHINRLTAAQSLAQGRDFARAQVVLDRAYKISPDDWGQRIQDMIDAK